MLVFLLQESLGLVTAGCSVADRRLGPDVLTGLLRGHASVTAERALRVVKSYRLTCGLSLVT